MKLISLFSFLILNHVLSAQNNIDGWYLINNSANCNEESMQMLNGHCLSALPFLNNDFIESYRVSAIDSNRSDIFLIYNDSGARIIESFTAKHINESIAFIDNDAVLEVVTIQTAISMGILGLVLSKNESSVFVKKLETIGLKNKQ